MNLIFFGDDLFSVEVFRALLESDLPIVARAIVLVEPISISGKRLIEFGKRRGIPIIVEKSIRDKVVQSRLLSMAPDLIIAAHFQRILPVELYARATMGALNLHPSLLPKYRGMSPQHWPIAFGDSFTGVTVHRMEEAVDTGRIIRQVPVALEQSTYIIDLQRKFLAIYGQIMVEAVRLTCDGYIGTEQSIDGGSYFPKIREEDMQLDIEMTLKRAYGMIRAFSLPYAGAWIDDLRVIRAIPLAQAEFDALARKDSTLGIRWHNEALYLVLRDGALEITKWKKS